jgi:hypothetical protein
MVLLTQVKKEKEKVVKWTSILFWKRINSFETAKKIFGQRV